MFTENRGSRADLASAEYVCSSIGDLRLRCLDDVKPSAGGEAAETVDTADAGSGIGELAGASGGDVAVLTMSCGRGCARCLGVAIRL
jgi:hypothetical protein